MNLTMSISGEAEEIVKRNRQIKWTEIARAAIKEEALKLKKLEMLSKYLDKKPINRKDWQSMERLDWHPVDEIELKESFVSQVLKASREKSKRINSSNELFG